MSTDLICCASDPLKRGMRKRAGLVASPVGYEKGDNDHLEKHPDRRVQEAVLLVFNKFIEIGSVRQTLMWFLENGLRLPTQTRSGEVCWKRPGYARSGNSQCRGGRSADREAMRQVGSRG